MDYLILALVGSYLVGSIPTAYLVVKSLKQIDVRTVGSGNVGATNVTRAAGLWAGVLVFVIDVLKGLIAVRVIAPYFIPPAIPVQLSCGLAAVIGHIWPIFLRFRGGKGVATTIGVLAGTIPAIAGLYMIVWLVCVGLWRYVSVGSIVAAMTIPLAQVVSHRPTTEILLGLALAVLVITKHRSNMIRLVQGTEHRIGSKEH